MIRSQIYSSMENDSIDVCQQTFAGLPMALRDMKCDCLEKTVSISVGKWLSRTSLITGSLNQLMIDFGFDVVC